MDFRLAAADDANKIATLLTDVFANYNMYRTVLSKHFTADSKYIDFLNKMHYVQAKSNIRRGYCLVAEEDDNIIAVAILQDLSKTRITVWDYIRSGALDLLPYSNVVHHFLPFLERSSEAAKYNVPTGAWYLESFLVSPQWQGKRIGGKFLDKAVVPLVAANGGHYLSLSTNTAMNVFFYKKHGFKQIDKEEIEGVEVWSLLKELKN